MRRSFTVLVAALVATSSPLHPQTPTTAYAPLDSLKPPTALAALVTVNARNVSLRDVLSDVASQAGVSIVFDPTLDGIRQLVSLHADRVTAAHVIARLLASTNIGALVSDAGTVVLTAARAKADRLSALRGVINAPHPLAGVHVALSGTRFETVSNDRGEFDFGRVPAGTYRVAATHIGFRPVERTVAIDGAVPPLELEMTPIVVPLAAVVVTPGYFGVMQSASGAATLSRTQIETVPQLGEDVYRAVARLPGVSTTDMSAKFAVRGEPGDELLVTLDGLPLIEPYHLRDVGNALSIIDLASLGGAELMTGGPGVEYGDQIAGVFRLHTLEPQQGRPRTSLGFSLTNLRGMSQGSFADGKSNWLVSGRRGYLDLAFKLANLADSIYPRYNDVFAKLSYALPGGGRVAVHTLHAEDQLRYQDAREPGLDSKYSSDYVWANATGQLGSALHMESLVWLGALDWSRDGSGTDLNRGWPSVTVGDARSFRSVGLREDWALAMGDRALLKIGGELLRETASYDYARKTQRLVVVGHTLVTTAESATVSLSPRDWSGALYLAQRIRPVEPLTVEAGLRYEPAARGGAALAEPRASAAWQPVSRTTLRVSWGAYAQRQSLFALQVQDGVYDLAGMDRARQIVAGWDQDWSHGLTSRIEHYDRAIPQLRPAYTNVTTSINAFPELAFDRVLVAPTSGRSRGVELSLARNAGRNIDWNASYTHGSATQVVNGARIARAGDESDALHADWSAHSASNKWRFTVSAFWHSGAPYTPDSVRIDTLVSPTGVQSARATWSTGALYSRRVSTYHRADARWTRFFDTRRGRVALFVEVYNLLNTSNIRDHYTNVSISRLNVTYFDHTREQLPRIPSFGVNWEF